MTGARATSVALMALAIAALLGTLGYPGGAQGVPGPALVPRLVAVALLLTAAWVAARPDALELYPMSSQRARAVVVTAVSLLAYVALWDVVPFVVRTAAALLLYLRLLDIAWRPAAIAAVALAVSVFVVFERFLAIRL